MRRFSIGTLMAFVVLAGVGVAALKTANDLWAGMMLLTALAAFGFAILAVINLRGRERAWWQGFGVFSGGYLALTFGPWLPDNFQSKLGTAHIIRAMYDLKFQTPFLPKVKLVELDMTTGTSKTSWVTPTKPSYEHFQRVGHSLFTLMAGLVGGTIAAWLHASREAVDAGKIPQ
jgi:hypothetical protein